MLLKTLNWKILKNCSHSKLITFQLFALLKESYSQLSDKDLLACRKTVHAGNHVMSLVAMEAVLDERLPGLLFTKQGLTEAEGSAIPVVGARAEP